MSERYVGQPLEERLEELEKRSYTCPFDCEKAIDSLKDKSEMAELRGDNINERVDNLEKSEDKFIRQLTFIQKGFIVNKEVLLLIANLIIEKLGDKNK